jgi:hypothetical protein
MLSKLALFPVVFTIFYITCFVIYFLWREYSIAKKMFNISAARKCLQKKILPFSLVGILIMSISLLGYFYFLEKLVIIYLITLYNFIVCLLILIIFIDFISFKPVPRRIIFTYINKKEKERNFSLFIISLSSTPVIMFLIFSEKTIIFSSIYFISMNLCLGLHGLILSFNSLKLVEEGVIYKFRLIKWHDIHAYKNISDPLEWDKNAAFRITLRVRPSILHMSSFVQISFSSQDIDSMNQILEVLAERLPGKNL